MPRPKNTDKSITASDTPRQPKKMGKKAPLTDTLGWKNHFEEWANGNSDDICSPVREIIGKLDEKGTAKLIQFLINTYKEGRGFLLTLESTGFDPSKKPIPISEEQFKVLISASKEGKELERNFAVLILSCSEPPEKADADYESEGKPALRKFDALVESGAYQTNEYAIQLMRLLSKEQAILSEPLSDFMGDLIGERIYSHKMFSDDVLIWAATCLGESGDKGQIPLLKQLYALEYNSDAGESVFDALKALGYRGTEQFLLSELNPDEAKSPQEIRDMLSKKDQLAAYELLEKNRDIKKIVFSGSKALEVLPNPQAWITINDPGLAKEAVRLVSEKLGSKIQKFDNALSQSLGVRSKHLAEEHFRFYADEILDAAIQVSAMKELKADPEFSALLSKAKYSNGIKLRFTRREKSDLSLGDKCGDCTAKGSISFGNSVTWEINPAYNIVKMSSGGSFIGKINITLGKIAGEEAIIIDALEFNPQAADGKPLHEEAVECFGKTIGFLRQLAKKQNRSLFALTFSNSSSASHLLRSKGFHPVLVKGEGVQFLSPEEAGKNSQNILPPGNEPIQIKLLIPSEDVSRILAKGRFKGNPRLFYQMLDTTQAINSKEGKDLMDERLPILEREVLNPAQIENPEIAKAMRERDFETAAKLIFAGDSLLAKVKEIFKISPNMKISPAFLVPRMKKIYAADAWEMENLNKTFMVNIDNFVKL